VLTSENATKTVSRIRATGGFVGVSFTSMTTYAIGWEGGLRFGLCLNYKLMQ